MITDPFDTPQIISDQIHFFQNQTQLISKHSLTAGLKRLSFLTYFPTSTLLKVAFTTLYVDVKEPADLNSDQQSPGHKDLSSFTDSKIGRGPKDPFLPSTWPICIGPLRKS